MRIVREWRKDKQLEPGQAGNVVSRFHSQDVAAGFASPSGVMNDFARKVEEFTTQDFESDSPDRADWPEGW